LLPLPSFLVVLKWKWQQQPIVIALFFVLEKEKTMAMCHRFFCGDVVTKKATTTCYHCLLLWWCWSKEGNNNLLSLPSSMC
jgi:hypothetical protein